MKKKVDIEKHQRILKKKKKKWNVIKAHHHIL